MTELAIVYASVLNGLTMGAVYALIALGLTLIYGVLHIINFAHGAALMMALYGVYGLKESFGLDPYASLPVMILAMFGVGYVLQRWVIQKASHGKDENILLVTLGLAIVLENLALLWFKSDTRTIDTAYTLATLELGSATIALPKLVAFAGGSIREEGRRLNVRRDGADEVEVKAAEERRIIRERRGGNFLVLPSSRELLIHHLPQRHRRAHRPERERAQAKAGQ